MADHTTHDDQPDLGRCCACEKRGPDVRNIMMLDKKAPVPGSGWGCFVCHLPPDGAVAVICDGCLESQAAILFVCVGYPGEDQRALADDLHESFEHDLAEHEGDELSDGDVAEADEVTGSWTSCSSSAIRMVRMTISIGATCMRTRIS